jgi:integrase
MATVFKMPNRPFWFAQITASDGSRLPRRSTKTTLKREAERIAADWEAEERRKSKLAAASTATTQRAFARIVENCARLAEDGKLNAEKAEELIQQIRKLANPDTVEISLSKYFTKWISRRSNEVAPSTSTGHMGALRKWEAVAPAVMAAPITALTTAQVRSGVAAMQQGDGSISSTTASHYLGILRAVLHAATEDGLISNHPAKSRSITQAVKATATRGPKRVGNFTHGEIQTLLEHAVGEMKGMILFGYYTGLRMMDIARLTRANISGDMLVKISKKTEFTTHTPLHPQIVEWLAGVEVDVIFPHYTASSKAILTAGFKALMRRAKIPCKTILEDGEEAKRSFHSLRHSFASTLANADVSELVRMKLTGQTSSSIHRRYTHLDQSTLRDAISKLPRTDSPTV